MTTNKNFTHLIFKHRTQAEGTSKTTCNSKANLSIKLERTLHREKYSRLKERELFLE